MASRGRGRGRGALNYEALKKPGGLENYIRNEPDNSPDSLIARCIEDWHYAPTAATICVKEIAKEDSGTKYRPELIKKIQLHFKDKYIYREKDPKKFLGTMALLCQIFVEVKSSDGTPFGALVEPVIEVLRMMLDENATDTEIECSAAQLKSVVHVIGQSEKNYDDLLRGLRRNIRDKILESSVPRDVMSSLLDGTEAICVLLNKQK